MQRNELLSVIQLSIVVFQIFYSRLLVSKEDAIKLASRQLEQDFEIKSLRQQMDYELEMIKRQIEEKKGVYGD